MTIHRRPPTPAAPRRHHRLVPAAAVGLLLVLATACTGGQSGESSSASSAVTGAPAGGAATTGDAAAEKQVGTSTADGHGADQIDPAALRAAAGARSTITGADVVRTADLTVLVSDRTTARTSALRAVAARGGFLADEQSSNDGASDHVTPPPQGHTRLTLRVPVDAYSDLLEDLSALGHLEQLQQSSTDVTGTVVDVGSRIASQTASVERVRALLKTAGDLGDVLKVEAELARREADLESLQARYAAVTEQARLSTVVLTLLPGDAAAPAAAHGTGFIAGLTAGWHGFVTTAAVTARVLGAVLPFAVPLALVLGITVVVRRQWHRRRSAAGSSAA